MKGMNLISALYQVGEASVPVAFELVKKTEWVFNEKKEKWQRKSPTTNNEHYRQMLSACVKNRVGFRYVLNDVWYASSENMRHVKEELKKEFIMPLKSNRKVALSLEEKKSGNYEPKSALSNCKRTPRGEFTWSKCPSRCYCASKSSTTRMGARVFCIWLVATRRSITIA